MKRLMFMDECELLWFKGFKVEYEQKYPNSIVIGYIVMALGFVSPVCSHITWQLVCYGLIAGTRLCQYGIVL